jgi:hypothetical protein
MIETIERTPIDLERGKLTLRPFAVSLAIWLLPHSSMDPARDHLRVRRVPMDARGTHQYLKGPDRATRARGALKDGSRCVAPSRP